MKRDLADGAVSVEPAGLDDPRWNLFLEGRREATYAHLLGWGRVMQEAFGHGWHGFVAHEGGEFSGVLPLVRVRSRIFGDYLVSMPFINYGGPVGTPQARRALADAARTRASELGVGLLELRNREPLAAPGLAETHRKVTVILDLPDQPETLWNGLKAKVRSQVRRPMKEGMTASFGAEQLPAFYQVFCRNMRDLGTPVLPYRFFRALQTHLGAALVVCVVRQGEKPVAGGCGFTFGGEFELTWASSLRELNPLAPNMLLYWALMEEAARRGLQVFNFGRCTPGGGTHRFKLQWGGRDVPLPWSQWSPSGVTSTPSPDSTRFRMAVAAWQRLPVPVANLVGPLLSPSIP